MPGELRQFRRRALVRWAARAFVGVHDMFEKGNEVGGSETKRHYNLDKSFIGDDEANLMLLKEAHEGLGSA